MVENIKDPTLTNYSMQQPVKAPKINGQDSLIDHEDLKGILFLGVKGDISEVSGAESKLDFLA